jgi:putative CocE/NonD family hydrolase
MEVTGPLTANLWISSSALDTDFTVKLIDVYPPSADYPDGYALNLTDSIMRARFRDSFTKPELMTPGEVYQLSFPLYPVSNVFKQGHRIRVDISSSNFPRFDVTPTAVAHSANPARSSWLTTQSITTRNARHISCCRWWRDRGRAFRFCAQLLSIAA